MVEPETITEYIEPIGEKDISNPDWIKYDHNGGWKHPYKENEYFYHPWFDWNKPERWLDNPNAIQFWLSYRGGSLSQLERYRSDLSNPDNIKIY